MLELRDVNVAIAGVRVLRDVSLSLRPGICTVLIGRNGAGKTTTLRAIMGLVPIKTGAVTLEGLPLHEQPSYARAGLGLGYAPEDRRLISGFTIEENLLLPALALNLDAAERQRRLDEVYTLLPQLADMRKRPGGATSGGQGKMVALGRALMVGRKVVMLDEPFQGLAPALALDYAKTLAQLRQARTGLALLITESSPNLLDAIADETLRIERGAIEPAETEGNLARDPAPDH
ncbi:ABC transporter ATP-binding protein [Alkalilacustris brevis]|uniref:ABC transporter ATP-binding protein n=1 Tax=Alkalilacustris brevis TaxID=2026338 RepID=UPI000E0D2506|nr:ATP-binding cassette domain-containing protein [Alkalilacustris brevis]